MRILSGVVVALSVLGCSARTSTAPQAPVSYAAIWDGGVLTVPEVRAEVQRLPPALVEQYKSPEGQRQFVEALLAKRLLVVEARRLGLHETEDIARQLREFEERLVIQALLDQAMKAASEPTEAELRAYFAEHADDFRIRPRVRVARVLVRTGTDAKVAKKKASGLRARLLAREPLTKLALLGDGPERTNSGELGWLPDDSPLLKPSLTLKAGEISEVLDTPEGFAVLVLEEKEESRVPPFEEARPIILGRIGPTRQRRIFDDLVKRLKQQSHASINSGAFQ